MGPPPVGPPPVGPPIGGPPPASFGPPTTFGPPTGPEPQTPDSPGESDTRFIAGLASAGVGAAMLIVMAVSMSRVAALQDDPGFVAYRSGLTSSQHACETVQKNQSVPVPGASTPHEVNDLCNQASAFEIVSYVAGPVGGLLLAGGVLLIVTSDTVWPKLSGEGDDGVETTLTVLPQLGFDTAGATLHYRF